MIKHSGQKFYFFRPIPAVCRIIKYKHFFCGIIKKVSDDKIDPLEKKKGEAPPVIGGCI